MFVDAFVSRGLINRQVSGGRLSENLVIVYVML